MHGTPDTERARYISPAELGQWVRTTPGLSIQFFALCEELQGWIMECLPPDLGPYALVTVTPRTIQQSVQVWVARQWRLWELRDIVSFGWGKDFVHLWLVSNTLTPVLPIEISDNENTIVRVYALNGFVNLQRFVGVDGALGALSVGMVHKFVNVQTHMVIEHTGYVRVFEDLRRAIKKKLVYSSIHVFPDGSRFEETRFQRMTAGAVEAYKSGVRFANLPGRYLGPMK